MERWRGRGTSPSTPSRARPPLRFTHPGRRIPRVPVCQVGPPHVPRYRKSFTEVPSRQCHVAPEQKGQAKRSLVVGVGFGVALSGGLGLLQVGAVWSLCGGSLMGVHDCHQLPYPPSLVPSPRLTERRSSLLLPRASPSQTLTSVCVVGGRGGSVCQQSLEQTLSISQQPIATAPRRVLILCSQCTPGPRRTHQRTWDSGSFSQRCVYCQGPSLLPARRAVSLCITGRV